MSIARNILMHMFGRPRGMPGRLGGVIMASMNEPFAAWIIGLPDIQPDDKVLEAGFGPGRALRFLRNRYPGVYRRRRRIQGNDRPGEGSESGRVDLRYGLAESLPFGNDTFTKALAINSMQAWPDPMPGLREMQRVMVSGGRIALGFTSHSGQLRTECPECSLLPALPRRMW